MPPAGLEAAVVGGQNDVSASLAYSPRVQSVLASSVPIRGWVGCACRYRVDPAGGSACS